MSRVVSVLSVVCVLRGCQLSTATQLPRTAFPEKRGFQKSEFPRVVKIAENVYGYEEFHNPGMTTVSMFVVGRDGVMLVDGQGSPAATQRLLEAIAKTAGKPIKWYVVGSDHGDHTAGNVGVALRHHLHRPPDVTRAARTRRGKREGRQREGGRRGASQGSARAIAAAWS